MEKELVKNRADVNPYRVNTRDYFKLSQNDMDSMWIVKPTDVSNALMKVLVEDGVIVGMEFIK